MYNWILFIISHLTSSSLIIFSTNILLFFQFIQIICAQNYKYFHSPFCSSFCLCGSPFFVLMLLFVFAGAALLSLCWCCSCRRGPPANSRKFRKWRKSILSVLDRMGWMISRLTCFIWFINWFINSLLIDL